MNDSPPSAADALAQHRNCFVCGPAHGAGLGLRFTAQPDGAVRAVFDCDARYQGYADRLHGGVIALLLDEAMTYCLLHRGVVAVTGRLHVAFREPVRLGVPAEVRARVVDQQGPLYRMKAELRQNGRVVARAEAKFAEGPVGPTP